MYDESSSGYGRACSATPSSDAAATPGQQAWPEPGLSFGLIHPRPGPFTGGHPDRVCAVRGRWRTPVNAMQHCWKACWGQPLRSSNLLSSATSDQAIHKPRPCVRSGLARLRSLICSLIHSTYIGIKHPKVQAHASEYYRGCSRPLGVPAPSDQFAAGAVTMGERLGSDDATRSTQITDYSLMVQLAKARRRLRISPG
jgi:hypothetical protein